MSTVTCPQCSADVAADVSHCPECGHPLASQPRPRDDSPPPGDATERGPGVVDDTDEIGPPGDATERGPGEVDDTDEIGHEAPRQPRVPSDADAAEPAGPVVTCRSCGMVNPLGRTLCERCGMGLISVEDLVERRWERAWRGAGVVLGLTLIVVVGTVAGWLLLRDGSEDDAAPRGGAQAPSGAADPSEDATRSEPAVASERVSVMLRPGDTGPRVRAWQRTLREAGLEVDLDGVFGPGTQEATERFQASVGEEPTGDVTSRTLAAGRYASSLRRVGIILLRDGELERVPRRVDETQLARGALEALFAAPLVSERDAGLSTAIPSGVTVAAVSVGDGTATVRLRGFAAATGAGNLQARVDQVVRTLTLFDSIDDVRFVLPADEMAVFADAGIPLDRPQGAERG